MYSQKQSLIVPLEAFPCNPLVDTSQVESKLLNQEEMLTET